MRLFRNILILILCLFVVQTANAGWTKKKLTVLAWLHSVHFITEEKGWIVGSNGTFLYTIDAGKTWLKKKNFTDDTILDIHFFDEKNGWILCERNVYSATNVPPSYLLKTSDGGEKWEKIEFSDGTGRERISKFFFGKSEKGIAVGQTGSVFSNSKDSLVWKKQTSPTLFRLLDGSFQDESNSYLVGAGGAIFFTEDSGETWKSPTISGNSKTRFNSIFFATPKVGWVAGAEGKIFSTLNGGKLWRQQNSNTTNDLTSIAFFDSSNGFAIGNDGIVLQTQNGGNVWRPTQLNTKHKLERIFLIGKTAWAVGFGGTVFYYKP
jgi:photosystem II stability/assembly factor-like uncharacterized protein